MHDGPYSEKRFSLLSTLQRLSLFWTGRSSIGLSEPLAPRARELPALITDSSQAGVGEGLGGSLD